MGDALRPKEEEEEKMKVKTRLIMGPCIVSQKKQI
jgi:hypothetical protein